MLAVPIFTVFQFKTSSIIGRCKTLCVCQQFSQTRFTNTVRVLFFSSPITSRGLSFSSVANSDSTRHFMLPDARWSTRESIASFSVEPPSCDKNKWVDTICTVWHNFNLSDFKGTKWVGLSRVRPRWHTWCQIFHTNSGTLPLPLASTRMWGDSWGTTRGPPIWVMNIRVPCKILIRHVITPAWEVAHFIINFQISNFDLILDPSKFSNLTFQFRFYSTLYFIPPLPFHTHHCPRGSDGF